MVPVPLLKVKETSGKARSEHYRVIVIHCPRWNTDSKEAGQ